MGDPALEKPIPDSAPSLRHTHQFSARHQHLGPELPEMWKEHQENMDGMDKPVAIWIRFSLLVRVVFSIIPISLIVTSRISVSGVIH